MLKAHAEFQLEHVLKHYGGRRSTYHQDEEGKVFARELGEFIGWDLAKRVGITKQTVQTVTGMSEAES
jgi:hypothetical protein